MLQAAATRPEALIAGGEVTSLDAGQAVLRTPIGSVLTHRRPTETVKNPSYGTCKTRKRQSRELRRNGKREQVA